MSRLRTRRSDSESGAVLVELAILVPVLILLVLGMLEMGLAWRDSGTVTQATRQGARVVANFGDDADADLQALVSVMTVMASEAGRVEYIIIYDASAAGGEVPAGCHTGSQAGVCNTYVFSDLVNLTTSPPTNTALFQCGGAAVQWCPNARSDTFSNLDHVGVYMKVDRPWVTNIFPGDGLELSGYTVMQVEPELP